MQLISRDIDSFFLPNGELFSHSNGGRSQIDSTSNVNGTSHANGTPHVNGTSSTKSPPLINGSIATNGNGSYSNGSSHVNGFKESKLLVWSAAEEDGLKRLAAVYSEHFSQVEQDPSQIATYLGNLAHTLGTRRSLLPWRSFVVTDSIEPLRELDNWTTKRSSTALGLGFIFNGQGAQWFAMGRELLVYPVFKQSLLDAESYMFSQGCSWFLLGKFSSI